MPISLQPSHKAELRVEVGKTTVEELQKFQQDVQAKGGGEIRARKNEDGSHTLYVAADKKVRLRAIFGQSYGSEARAGKVALAKDLMKEIISRRLPDRPDGQNTALLARIDERSSVARLGLVLDEVRIAGDVSHQEMYDKMPPKLQDHYKQLGTIMTTPNLKEAFGASMEQQFVKENFDFLSLVQQYEKTSNPHEKLALAEKIYKMVESPENPPSRSAMQQINLSATMAGKITEGIEHLRQAIVPGQEPSEQDKQLLNDLFAQSKGEIIKLSKPALENFIGGHSFKAEAAKAHSAKVSGESSSVPASRLDTGSGEAFNKQVDSFTSIPKLMGDPEIRAAYKQHLSGGPQQGNFERYEQIEVLAQLAESGDISDEELLQHCQEMFVDNVPEDQRDDPFFEMVSSRLQGIREEHETLGGDMESRIGQEQLFGPEEDGQDNLVRGKLKDFLKDMQSDAGNGLKGDGLKSFVHSPQGERTGQLGKIVAQRMFDQDMDWSAGKESHVGSFERFRGKDLEGSGGATGSGRAKVGGQFFQVKDSISHAGLGRRMKAGGLNTENYGEVISSNIARSMLPKGDRRLVPEVALRQDGVNHEAIVTSKYLSGGKGDLKGLYIELAGPLPRGQKHPKIELDAPEGARSGGGVLRLSGQASRDVQRNIALSALMGDHDVNPGNMIATQDGRVGRIDFGHAFNELINGIGGTTTGGGGVRNKSNRVLDFFNREEISGNPLVRGQNKPKLWRDYTGAGPSEGMTQALRDIAGSQDALEGITQAKSQFTDLIAQLEAEGTPEARAQIKDLTESLARIARNIEKPITSTEPGEIVKDVFNNIEAFVVEGQAQMREVANLSELQTKIDAFISSTRDNPDAPIPDDIQQAYTQLLNSSVKLEDGSGLNWMKHTDGTPAFQGSLTDFIQTRRTEIVGE